MKRPAIVFTTSAAAAIMMCGLAYGADLAPAPAYRPAPIMSPVPAYSWTGVYVGLNGGGAWGSQDPYNIITNRFDHLSTSISGGLFGGTVGAQVQVNYVVLGLEADPKDGTPTPRCTGKRDEGRPAADGAEPPVAQEGDGALCEQRVAARCDV
jgi:opacity protein-like surface antigen